MADTIINLSTIDHNDIIATPVVEKKRNRGRPKNTDRYAAYNIKKEQIAKMQDKSETSSDEEMILHLKIDDIESSAKSEQENEDKKKQLKKKEKEVNKINEHKLDLELQDIINEIGGKPKKTEQSSDYVKNLENENAELKRNISELKKCLNEYFPMYYTPIKVYPLDTKMFMINEKDDNTVEFIPQKTDMKCWWCSYSFDCLPSYIPEKYHNNHFYVWGNFCSFNCASAYNLNMKDNRMFERGALLKQLYYMINKDKIKSYEDIDINPTGPKELLVDYGGTLTIDELRKKAIMGYEYNILLPPFIPINIGMVEANPAKTKKSLPMSISNILRNNNDTDYVLKRTKPLNHSSSKTIDNLLVI